MKIKLPAFLRRLRNGRNGDNNKKKKKQRKQNMSSSISSPIQEIQDSIRAERSRLDYIKQQLDENDFDCAFRNLLNDSSADLHYFNSVKSELDPRRHDAALSQRHGKLIDFTVPKDMLPPKDCCWVGQGYRHKRYRCHNPSLVKNGKEMSVCSYHAKFCINDKSHPDVPVKISCPNEKALCNECFVLTYGHPPKPLKRIPGTRKI
jgi:hypothetical protein